MSCHNEDDLLGHPFTDQREEAAIEVGGTPFPVRSCHIELVKGVPVTGFQIGSRQNVDLETWRQRLAPFLLDRLALSRVQRREKIVEIAEPVIRPMKLLAHPLQKSRFSQRLQILGFGKIDV